MKNKQALWISRIDQIKAEERDEVMNSNTEIGSKMRMRMAMSSIQNGDLNSFTKWINLDREIRENK